jgi:hypothetical protein
VNLIYVLLVAPRQPAERLEDRGIPDSRALPPAALELEHATVEVGQRLHEANRRADLRQDRPADRLPIVCRWFRRYWIRRAISIERICLLTWAFAEWAIQDLNL